MPSLSQLSVTRQRKRTYIFINGRRMASVVGDELQQNREGSKHFLHSPKAIAFSYELLRKAKEAGAVRVPITDKETRCNYRTTVEAIEEHGIPIYRGKAEPQVALPLPMWRVTKPRKRAADQSPGAPQAERGAHGPQDGQTPERGAERLAPLQLGLFEGAGR